MDYKEIIMDYFIIIAHENKISNKKRDGFAGELLISIPQNVLAGAIQKGQILPHQLYVSHIGYFPKALYHYCQRPQGCVDNILFYCVQGKGYYTLDGHTFTLNPNQYVIVPATDKPLVYWSDTEDPWSIYWVHFTSDALQAFNRVTTSFRNKVRNTFLITKKASVSGKKCTKISAGAIVLKTWWIPIFACTTWSPLLYFHSNRIKILPLRKKRSYGRPSTIWKIIWTKRSGLKISPIWTNILSLIFPSSSAHHRYVADRIFHTPENAKSLSVVVHRRFPGKTNCGPARLWRSLLFLPVVQKIHEHLPGNLSEIRT